MSGGISSNPHLLQSTMDPRHPHVDWQKSLVVPHSDTSHTKAPNTQNKIGAAMLVWASAQRPKQTSTKQSLFGILPTDKYFYVHIMFLSGSFLTHVCYYGKLSMFVSVYFSNKLSRCETPTFSYWIHSSKVLRSSLIGRTKPRDP